MVVMATVMTVVVMMLVVVTTMPALTGAAERPHAMARGAMPSEAIAPAGAVAAMNLNDVTCFSLRS